MKIYYRISDGSYKKNRLENATKQNCLSNFINEFDKDDCEIIIFADNVSDDTFTWLTSDYPHLQIARTKYGSSAGSFRGVFQDALDKKGNDSSIIYFLEDDYFHSPNSKNILLEGIEKADYVSLYDHPDKYVNKSDGGNPLVENGGEITRVILTESTHWKLTNSSTMTFASKIKTLWDDRDIWRKYTQGSYPRDFDAFMELRKKGRSLITPIPGYSTHCEVEWLSPFTDWRKI